MCERLREDWRAVSLMVLLDLYKKERDVVREKEDEDENGISLC